MINNFRYSAAFAAATLSLLQACGTTQLLSSDHHSDVVQASSAQLDSELGLLGSGDDTGDGIDSGNPLPEWCRADSTSAKTLRVWREASPINGTRYDTWTVGPRFGRSSAEFPNIGYTSRSGTINNGEPTGDQPASLACGAANWPIIGWRYSNNIAGLKQTVRLDQTIRRPAHSTEDVVSMHVMGDRNYTYIDPALTAPWTDSPSSPFYDASFDGGRGRFVITRHLEIGARGGPANQIAIWRGVSGEDQAVWFALRTGAEAPIVEVVEHSLEPSMPVLSRTFKSGSFVATYSDGTTTRTSLSNVVLRRDADGQFRCRPIDGLITTEISTTDPTSSMPSISIARHFGANAHTNVRCSDQSTDCTAKARAAVAAYGPGTCLY